MKVFLSFRNGDESFAVPLVFRALARRLGPQDLFWSRESIGKGDQFPRALIEAVERCEIMLVFIGPRWLTMTNERGRRLVSRPQDWVRKEIALALQLGKRVIPIMLQGTPRLKRTDLPPSIAKLWKQQSFRLDTFDDKNQLARIVDEVATMVGAQSIPSPSRSARASQWPIWNVPSMPRNTVDRSALIADVRLALESGLRQRSGPVIVCGVPGVGKTWLAKEYAYRYAASYELVWWISGEPAEVMSGQLADLARLLGIEVPSDLHLAMPLLFGRLRQRGPWLLIFDDVSESGGIRPFLPEGPDGHVLITSRNPDWSSLGQRLDVDIFTKKESASLLQTRLTDLANDDVQHLATAIGGLPLAVAQAAAFLDQSTITPAHYLGLLKSDTGKLLRSGADEVYGRSLAATWSLAIDRLRDIDARAVSIVELCSVFAASPIPLDILAAAGALRPDLASLTVDPIDYDMVLKTLRRSGLLDVTVETIEAHRVFQDFVRGGLGGDRCLVLCRAAIRALAAQPPSDPRDPLSWPRFRLILPHLLALNLLPINVADGDEPSFGRLILDAAHFLLLNGDPQTARELVGDVIKRWHTSDAPVELVLEAQAHLARILFHSGKLKEALAQDQDVLRELRARFGDEHPDTLLAWQNVAADLAAFEPTSSTLQLHEELVRRWRSAVGNDHVGTMRAIHNLAAYLRVTRQPAKAWELDSQNLPRLRQTLGPDHVDTLASAAGLAADLRSLGDYASARELDEDTFERRQRVCGPDHAATLAAAHSLAMDRRECEDPRGARELDEQTYSRRRRLLGDVHEATLRSGFALLADLRAIGDARAALELMIELRPGLRALVASQEPGYGAHGGR